MSTLVLTDPHFGEYSHGFIDRETGLNSRLLDIKGIFERIIHYAKENKVKRIVVAGDSYDVKNPKNFIRALFADSVTEALKSDIEIYVMTGNHDMTQSAGTGHSLSEMEMYAKVIPNLTVISTPTILNWDNTDWVFFPHVNRGDHGILARDDIKEWNKTKIKELSAKVDSNSVLIGHFSTDASCEVDKQAIEIGFLQGLNFGLILLGHIHKQQKLTDKIYHIGSMARTDFHEEKSKKYFAIINNLDISFEEIHDREFKTFNLNLNKNITKFKVYDQSIRKLDLSKVVTRLIVTIKEEDESKVEIDALEDYIRDTSWKFTGTVKNIIQGDVDETFMDNDQSPLQLFEVYVNENPTFFGTDSEFCLNKGTTILESLM